MSGISVVIITKNEADNIVDCIESAKLLSTDIIVVDSGSDDNTIPLAKSKGAKVSSVFWSSYGDARNTGAMMASREWILALDADERVTPELAECIAKIDLRNENKIYGFKRINFINKQKISYGPLGHDRVFRLYNRHLAAWNNVPVHESLTGKNMLRCTLKAKAEHYGNKNPQHYLMKKLEYANLWAIKHQHEGKKVSFAMRITSTFISFIKAYIFQLGFLDRRNGFLISKINAKYTWYKYGLLQKLLKAGKEKKRSNNVSLSFQNLTPNPLSKREGA